MKKIRLSLDEVVKIQTEAYPKGICLGDIDNMVRNGDVKLVYPNGKTKVEFLLEETEESNDEDDDRWEYSYE